MDCFQAFRTEYGFHFFVCQTVEISTAGHDFTRVISHQLGSYQSFQTFRLYDPEAGFFLQKEGYGEKIIYISHDLEYCCCLKRSFNTNFPVCESDKAKQILHFLSLVSQPTLKFRLHDTIYPFIQIPCDKWYLRTQLSTY